MVKAVRGFSTQDQRLHTSSFKKVTTACKEHKLVTLVGPKGCGKTFLAVAMFVIFSKFIDCLLLSANAFDKRYTSAHYFKTFVNHHLPTGIRVHIHEKLDENLFLGVQEIILKFKNPLFLFVDLSLIKSEHSSIYLLKIIMLAKRKPLVTVLTAVSSGGLNLSGNKILETNLLCLSEGVSIVFTGFTNKEAAQYVEKCGSPFTYEEVKHVSGTNPLLLLLIPKHGSCSTVSLLHEYKRQVSHIVDNFIQDNFAVLKKNPETVENFI